MQRTNRKRSEDSYKVLCGTCPDEQCHAKLFFPAYDKSVECTSCGQRHEKSSLLNIAEVTNPSVALHNILKNILLGNVKPKKGPDNVKVLGLSNYVCKLISPILTHYGMDKKTGKAKLLTELSQTEIFDCGKILGDRAFIIEEENLDVVGYGRDRSGSTKYLADTLNVIKEINDGQECLVPIHADGDGHCLVHAISRSLVGRELFWHALRLNLMNHLKTNLEKYKDHFKDFVDSCEWEGIINECDPDFLPADGEPLGLRNIHVFGLANVLRRPIILLDSLSGIKSSADYSGIFLPAMVPPEVCRGKDGLMNKPLCIAWSSFGRNHYIPMVGVKGRPNPKLPRYMIQKAWGMPTTLIDKYLDFDTDGCCYIGGDKCLNDKYIRQLVTAMEEVFIEKYGVQPQLVADVHQYLYKTSGIVGVAPEEVLRNTQNSIKDKRLYRCLTCEALTEYHLPPEWFRNGGSLYNLAKQTHGELKTDKKYSFPFQGVICTYDDKEDTLVPDMNKCKLSRCTFCQGDNVRLVNGDGSIQYINGDRTSTRTTSGKCACGFKHYWDGKEYDNLPEIFPISLEWNGKVVGEKVVWFQYEADPILNSNVFEVAHKLVQKHFPGEFGSERLVQRVVDTILRQTETKKMDTEEGEGSEASGYQDPVWSPESPSKIILTGYKHKTLHKEELMKSEAEKQVKQQTIVQAPKHQQKKSAEIASTSAPKSSPRRTKSLDSADSTSRDHHLAEVFSMDMKPKSLSTNEKRVRIATSDGKQMMMTLTSEVTFHDLQNLIADKVGVPAERQRIRLGFPPKEVKPPPDDEADPYIALQHGDKITLEILPDPSTKKMETDYSMKKTGTDHSKQKPGKFSAMAAAPRNRGSWSSFEEDAHTSSAENLLQSLREAQDATDSLDSAIASLAIMSTITGKDLWTYVQTMPHLFSVGGLFYKQVERDLGLVDGKHCQLPALPGKVFRFNATEGRLELCLEPFGHFAIEPNVEIKAKETVQFAKGDNARFGSSGAISKGSKHAAFTGQGHSLRPAEVERMPTDIPDNSSHHHARKLHSLCDPSRHQDSIAEDPGAEEEEEANMLEETASNVTSMKDYGISMEDSHRLSSIPEETSSPVYQRLGPGFSVLDQEKVNTSNENIQMFKDLAESIEKTMNEDIALIDQEMERIDSNEELRRNSLRLQSTEEPPLLDTVTDCQTGTDNAGFVDDDVFSGKDDNKTENVTDQDEKMIVDEKPDVVRDTSDITTGSENTEGLSNNEVCVSSPCDDSESGDGVQSLQSHPADIMETGTGSNDDKETVTTSSSEIVETMDS